MSKQEQVNKIPEDTNIKETEVVSDLDLKLELIKSWTPEDMF